MLCLIAVLNTEEIVFILISQLPLLQCIGTEMY